MKGNGTKKQREKTCGFSGGKDLVMLGLFHFFGNLAHDLSMTFGKAEKIN